MFGFEMIALLIILGLLTGFFSGLLGIGGGTIIVPGLALLFHHFNYQTESLYMQFAAGSALTIMIFSSLSSVRKNYKLQMIYTPALKPTIPWLILSVIIGAIIAANISSELLSLIFAALLLYILVSLIIQILSRKSVSLDTTNPKISKNKLRFCGFFTGILSGLLGLGGGIISVPVFKKLGLSMKQAAGTSSVVALIVSLVGAILFGILGYLDHIDLQFATGYIYWPAVLLIIPFAIIAAPAGVKLKHKLSDTTVLIIFVIYILIVMIKMYSLFIAKYL